MNKILKNYKIEIFNPGFKELVRTGNKEYITKYLYVNARSKSDAKKLAKIIYNFHPNNMQMMGKAILDNE